VILERNNRSVALYVQGHDQSASLPEFAALLTVGGPKPAPLQMDATETLTDVLRPSPIFEGGFLVGYEVQPGKDENTFLALGLRPGDVIVSIDSEPVASPDTVLSNLRSIMQGSAVIATIRRDGVTRSLSLDGTVVLAEEHRHRATASSMSGSSKST
jgi:type II secretion system protein C